MNERSVPAPPVARKIPREVVLHGDRLQDDYDWLRRKDDPEVLAYLEAENVYTAAVMQPTEALQESLYQEMLGRIQETDLEVPYRQGGHLYYSRTEQGKQYRIHCRKQGSLDAPEEILLDLNELAEGRPFLSLGVYQVSDDGNLLAFSLDVTGFRQYTLAVKDLRTGEIRPERWERVTSVAWTADNQTFFYVQENDAKRPHRLFRHRLGEDGDTLVYEEEDDRFYLGVSRSRSRQYLFAHSGSMTTSEVRYLPADTPTAPLQVIAPREADHEYDVDHHGDRFYIRTNSGGRNFRLVTAPVGECAGAPPPARENWTEIIPHRADVMIVGVDLFARAVAIREREDGLPQLRILDLASGEFRRIAFPEPAYSFTPIDNREFDAREYRISYQSLTTPRSIFDLDPETGEWTLRKQEPVLGGYDPSQYQSERVYATAADGARIPISLVYRKGMTRDGTSPLLLQGYGAYGAPSFPSFSSARVSLLDRGVTFAIAHIRGGGEMGKPWHDQGRMLAKRNSFTDFVAAAEHLIAEQYTSPGRLVIQGGSAGGLLIGAVVNMRPDLCRAAILHVPFVDVLNTMSDPSLPLTVIEFEEWGNPQIEEQYRYMQSYCPYTNLASRDYPAMLVKTSLNDSQVMYWEPAKYVAKLRAIKTDRQPLLFKTNMAGGHGGHSGRYDHLRETAYDTAFIMTQLGIQKE
jgi:oligopeptidase B